MSEQAVIRVWASPERGIVLELNVPDLTLHGCIPLTSEQATYLMETLTIAQMWCAG